MTTVHLTNSLRCQNLNPSFRYADLKYRPKYEKLFRIGLYVGYNTIKELAYVCFLSIQLSADLKFRSGVRAKSDKAAASPVASHLH